ncbi:hypothetical protein FOL47_003655 [Perkinsus chesapeaki]|uniref:Uncharacterized protein n=1 Tax=Perkinsus chesapeaki TaxID=330153 RepID=A0A7J6M6P3_PERCH|nr:hypothetical protein FOL47_003655 [Perkinsus chesapeaki]
MGLQVDEQEVSHSRLATIAPFLAGATAGLVCDATVFPMDTIRVRYRGPAMPEELRGASNSTGLKKVASRLQRYSLLSEASAILRTEGIRGFYKGLSVVMLTSCPAFGVYYLTYEALKSRMSTMAAGKEWSQDVVHLTAGALANVCGMVIWTPQEVVKSQTQVQTQSSINPSTVVRQIYSQNGVRGFYRGAVIGSLTWTPLSAIWFMSFERLKSLSARQDTVENMDRMAPGALALSGFIAGVIACTATSPIDVVKTQYQVAGRGVAASSLVGSSPPSTAVDIAGALLRNEGPIGFFRGVCAKSVWYGTFMAINITVYNSVKLALQECGS